MSGARSRIEDRDIHRFRKPSASMRIQTPAFDLAPSLSLLSLLVVLSVLVLAV